MLRARRGDVCSVLFGSFALKREFYVIIGRSVSFRRSLGRGGPLRSLESFWVHRLTRLLAHGPHRFTTRPGLRTPVNRQVTASDRWSFQGWACFLCGVGRRGLVALEAEPAFMNL